MCKQAQATRTNSSGRCHVATQMTARAVAVQLTRTLGRTITDKAVRSWVRDHVAGHDKTKHPEYQAHLYDAATVAKITAGFKARSANARVQNASKSKVTPKAKAKVTAAKAKAAPKAKVTAPTPTPTE